MIPDTTTWADTVHAHPVPPGGIHWGHLTPPPDAPAWIMVATLVIAGLAIAVITRRREP